MRGWSQRIEFTVVLTGIFVLNRFASAIVLFAGLISSTATLAEPLGKTDAVKAGFLPERLSRIKTYLEHEIALKRIPGAIVLIRRRGQTAYYEGFGTRSPATGMPMTPDTIFTLFSMTKPITSVAAMVLVEEGKLALDAEVGQYIPSFYNIKVGVEKAGAGGRPELDLAAPNRPILIHDLLRQSAGIPYASLAYGVVKKPYEDARLLSGDLTNAELADRIAALPLIANPGEYWVYGHATDVLGAVIEKVSGQTLYDFEKSHLLDPLGMTNTSFFVTDAAKLKLIAEPNANEKFDRDPRVVQKWQSGGGGMVASIEDYARFVQMLMNGGELDGKRILGRKTVEFMTANHIGPASGVKPWAYYFPGAGYGFGLGVAVRTEQGVNHWPGSIGEFEWSGGSGVYFLADPKEDMFAILMMQTQTQRGRIQSAFKSMVYGALK
ncbi:MAG: serine hydrolase [Afipia sp.]|nr:serine hydrolase [Afipia sp.]